MLDALHVLERFRSTEGAVLLRCRESDARCLIKRFEDPYPTPRQIALLRHEYAMCRRLADAPILTARGLEPDGHGLALVFDDPGTRPLRALLDEQPRVPLLVALQIARAIADALEQLHTRQTLHKHLQPENVFVDGERFTARLTGFGFAAPLEREQGVLQTRHALEGTLEYIAPEQTGRLGEGIDHRADLYSLGIILHELLAGRRPFDFVDSIELIHAQLAMRPPPLHSLVPELPQVADIVAKLLAKSPDQRYERASGLAHDLGECIAALGPGATSEPLVLGRHDPGRRPRVRDKLYGREHETARLLEPWTRVREGAAELLLVAGYSGIGKSLLVDQVRREVALTRGWFVAGKVDQLERTTPYLPIARALTMLVDHLLGEPSSVMSEQRERILAALARNAGLLITLVPAFERLLGPQPPVPELPDDAARHRLALTIQGLVRACARPERPLVLFIDDLQWLDAASLELLELIATTPGLGHLLLVGAYRDHEVDAAHLLHRTLARLRQTMRVSSIELGPLSRETVTELIADALDQPAARVEALAGVVFAKTGGNPYFLRRFLSALVSDGLIAFDPDAGEFRIDLVAVESRMVTDNVSAFMAGRIAMLGPALRHALTRAACIGHEFGLRRLAELAPEQGIDLLARGLFEAIDEGVLIPIGTDYRFFVSDAAGVPAQLDARFRFAHDRAQEAAYSLLDPRERLDLHMRLGLRALALPERDVFEIAAHLNRARAHLEDGVLRSELARINLEAGARARAAGAHAAAVEYLRVAAELLEAGSSEDEPWFAVQCERARCEALAGHLAEVEEVHALLAERVTTPRHRAIVHELRCRFLTHENRSDAAIEEALAGLRMLGVETHERAAEWHTAIGSLRTSIEQTLAGRSLADLVDAPQSSDPDVQLTQQLLVCLNTVAVGSRPELQQWSTVKAVQLSLLHGHGPTSARAYLLWGAHLGHFERQHAIAHDFCRLGLALHERRPSAAEASMNLYLAATVSHYQEPWRVAIEQLRRATTLGLESGDLLTTSFAATHGLLARVLTGAPLVDALDEAERATSLLQRTRVASSAAMVRIARQLVRALLGQVDGSATLDDAEFDTDALARELEAKRFNMALAWLMLARAIPMVVERAHDAPLLDRLVRANELHTLNFTPELRLYTCLALLDADDSPDLELRSAREAELRRRMAELEQWARDCPANYEPGWLLVQAEQARRAGDQPRAIELHERAIAAAEQHESPAILAQANERLAELHLARGQRKIARVYMIDACYAFARWGARAKLRRLRHAHPTLVPIELLPSGELSTSGEPAGDAIDIEVVLRIQRLLAGRVALSDALEQVMRAVMQDTGAERAVLLRVRDGELFVDVVADAASGRLRGELDTPLADFPELPHGLVRYAHRTQQAQVFADAANEHRLAGDPYVVAARPRSLACMVMACEGRSVGVVYLDNASTPGLFTRARVDLLRVLLAQAAIAIENAELIHAAKQSEAEREQLRARLAQAQRLEALGTLAGGIAHDFNNLLMVMLGNLELARLHAEPDTLVAECLAEIEQAGVRAKELVAGVLAFGRPRAATRTPTALAPLLAEVVALLRGLLPGEVELSYEIAAELPAIAADAAQLHRVLLNLGTNALHALEGGPGRIELSAAALEVDAELRRRSPDLNLGPHVRLRVRDSGVGMSAGVLERMFEPFFTTKAVGHGTGLGLSVVHGIVRAHRGAIVVESAPGCGTTFDIYLPIAGDELPRTRTTIAASEAHPTVLCVEDDPSVARVLERMLVTLGYRPTITNQPSEARILLDSQHFAIVLVDRNMPNMSGLELIRAIREERPRLPIVLGSGYLSDADLEQAFALGVTEIVQKPYGSAQLHQVLRSLVGGS